MSINMSLGSAVTAAQCAGMDIVHNHWTSRSSNIGWAYGKAFRAAELAYDLAQEHALRQRRRLLDRIESAITERWLRTEHYEFAYEQCLNIVRAERLEEIMK